MKLGLNARGEDDIWQGKTTAFEPVDDVIDAEVVEEESTIEPDHAEALAAVAAVESNPGYCSGCGTTFRGAAGLRSHQSRPFITLACRPR